MKATFRLQGLDCANCASKIEAKIKKLEGVTDATLNFITTKLIIEGPEDQMGRIAESAREIIKKHEPHVKMQQA